MQMSLQSQLSQKETLKRGSQELAISTTWPSAWWTLLSTKAKSLSTKAKLLCNDQSSLSFRQYHFLLLPPPAQKSLPFVQLLGAPFYLLPYSSGFCSNKRLIFFNVPEFIFSQAPS